MEAANRTWWRDINREVILSFWRMESTAQRILISYKQNVYRSRFKRRLAE
jgi:hypothetical protein